MLLIGKVDLQGTNCAEAKKQTLKHIYSLSCNFSVEKLQVWDSPEQGWGLICHFHCGINWIGVCVCVCVNEFWLCNVITVLFNLSERDLSHFHNHHRSSQDSSYYFATGPTQRSQVCVGCSETTSDTHPRSLPEPPVIPPSVSLPRTVSSHSKSVAVASFCELWCTVPSAQAWYKNTTATVSG